MLKLGGENEPFSVEFEGELITSEWQTFKNENYREGKSAVPPYRLF